MAGEEHYPEQQWTIQSISNNSALVLYEAEMAYVIGTTPGTFVLKALKGGSVVEEASVCHSHGNCNLVASVTVDNSTTRLQAAFDGNCVLIRYFRDNELALEEEASVLAGYSAPARKIATDRQVYEKAVNLRRLIEKLRADSFFRAQVLRSINQFANPAGLEPIDYCDWVCKQCWHGMYLPHSCIACIFCNGFTLDTGAGGID
jgi:hypothetical protein